jgi:hypothetical protein
MGKLLVPELRADYLFFNIETGDVFLRSVRREREKQSRTDRLLTLGHGADADKTHHERRVRGGFRENERKAALALFWRLFWRLPAGDYNRLPAGKCAGDRLPNGEGRIPLWNRANPAYERLGVPSMGLFRCELRRKFRLTRIRH